MNTNNKQNRNDGSLKRESRTYTDYNIFAGNIRLVLEGKPPVVMDRDRAIAMAKERGMNLVQIAYNRNDNPRSVCKIMDYSKFKYEQKKKDKEARKKQREALSEIKEIKFSIRIDDGDKDVKISKIREILSEGDKVRITIWLLRREMGKRELAKNVMKSILDEFTGFAELDQNPSFVGNTLSCTIRRKNQCQGE